MVCQRGSVSGDTWAAKGALVLTRFELVWVLRYGEKPQICGRGGLAHVSGIPFKEEFVLPSSRKMVFPVLTSFIIGSRLVQMSPQAMRAGFPNAYGWLGAMRAYADCGQGRHV